MRNALGMSFGSELVYGVITSNHQDLNTFEEFSRGVTVRFDAPNDQTCRLPTDTLFAGNIPPHCHDPGICIPCIIL